MVGGSGSVGFDGFYFQHATTGIGQYASQLWRTFQNAGGTDPEIRLLLPESHDNSDEMTSDAVSVRSPAIFQRGKASKLWWEQRGLVRAARRAGVDVVHTPYFSAPYVTRLPVIVTIHDVIPYVYPAYRNSFSMRLYLRLVTNAAHRAAAILTDSECSRRDIERFLGIERNRIRVIPLAADDRFGPERDTAAEQEIRDRLNLPGPVIFNVGGLDVRKNVGALIRAFAIVLPDLDPKTRLVIAGQAHTGNRQLYPPLEPLIRELGISEYVILPGRISEADKLRLYNVADLYVFTSLYEGFGLSPLEAMACGTPVICSNRSSLPEVVGGGGILVDPVPEKIAGAMGAVMTDRYLRRRLGGQALERAARFSWERTAKLTRDTYREVLNAH